MVLKLGNIKGEYIMYLNANALNRDFPDNPTGGLYDTQYDWSDAAYGDLLGPRQQKHPFRWEYVEPPRRTYPYCDW